MDRLTQLRSEAGGSRDSTFETSSAPSEAYCTANESSSKYFSLSEEDSAFDISPIKDVSLASAANHDKTDQLISNLSPIAKQNDLLDYKFGKQIEAANILSGGVDIFADNENSYDGDELVIDDNVVDMDEKSNPELKAAENIGLPFQKEDEVVNDDAASKDTEIVLHIDGKNVNAINIGNGLYLYRKEGQEELAAVQIVDDNDQQPSFKFLKVRENAEGNLEVYEEIEVEVPKDAPAKEDKHITKNASCLPTTSKVLADPVTNKVETTITKSPPKEIAVVPTIESPDNEVAIELKTENLNNKMTKFNETRKSPVIHSTPNKEGIPLTKTMVDQQLHPHRHLDKVKTIEVHTDNVRQKLPEAHKGKDNADEKFSDTAPKNKDEAESCTTSAIETSLDKATDLIRHEETASEVELASDKTTEPAKNKENSKTGQDNTNSENTKADSPSQTLTSLESKPEKEEVKEGKSIKQSEKSDSQHKEEAKIPENKQDIKKPEITEEKPQIVNSETSKKPNEISRDTKTEIKPNNEQDLSEVIKDNQMKSDFVEINELNMNKGELNRVSDHSVKDEKLGKEEPELESKAEVIVCHKEQSLGPARVENEDKTTLIDNTKSNKVVTKLVRPNNVDVIECTKGNETTMSINKTQTLQNHQSAEKDTIIEQNPRPSAHEASRHTSIEPKEVDTKKEMVTQDQKPQTDSALTKDVEKVSQQVESTKSLTVNKPEDTKIDLINKDKSTKNVPLQFSVGSKVLPIPVDPKLALKTTDVCKMISPEAGKTVQDSNIIPQNADIKHVSRLSTVAKPLTQSEAVIQQSSDKKSDLPRIATAKTNIMPVTVRSLPDSKTSIKKEASKVNFNLDKKAINNNHAAVPFGKWTEEHRQEFLNKIKESKVPVTTNTKQIKQPNDLNKREFLQKIDIQRLVTSNANAKFNELRAAPRHVIKTETKTYAIKPTASHDMQVPARNEGPGKSNFVVVSKPDKGVVPKSEIPPLKAAITKATPAASTNNQEAQKKRKGINNQDLIDKTIEGIINRVITTKPEELKSNAPNEQVRDSKASSSRTLDNHLKDQHPASLSALEMKMNELHGIPFVERPPHQLPKPFNLDVKTYSKTDVKSNVKVTNVLKIKDVKQNVIDVDSEEEVMEHEPITGDIGLSVRRVVSKLPTKLPVTETVTVTSEASKNDAIITETDFDKFARRTSITYENRLTVKFEGNESHNVLQTIVEKEPPILKKELPVVKKYSRNELLLAEAKVKSDQRQQHRINHPIKTQMVSKMHNDDTLNKHYQSKLQMAYQSALTAKRKPEPPITIIEDKPVKVVFIDTSTEFTPSQLNAQGKELSPAKKKVLSEPDPPLITTAGKSLDSDVMDTIELDKLQEDNKAKGKHQRKQVLAPVETPKLELIELHDLGVAESPKKKRKTEEALVESPKNIVPKKSYLLGRNTIVEDTESAPQDLSKTKITPTELVNQSPIVTHTDTASAIDNLVKAAELLETQSEKLNSSAGSVDSESSQPTPVKRGRGRPRKYPLGEGPQDNKVPSPQKRPRLIDAKPIKDISVTDDDTSDEEPVRENWTMGRINQNNVCPICNKLFRSEMVVFKHVKHCTGHSPNSVEADKVSRKSRQSQESETKSIETKSVDIDYEPPQQRKPKKATPKKRKSKDATSESSKDESDNVIVIEDTPKGKPRQQDSKVLKPKPIPGSLACDICGKTFRQLSYLVSHKWQHKKEETKKVDNDAETATKSVFSCETCKKEFRKLHHLVQHRLIHNASGSVSARSPRKSSSEQNDIKIKDQDPVKTGDDANAAFRCEPCDKSFRKLHHLVEHRETHDGQNRQKNQPVAAQAPEDKPPSDPPPQCDICQKTFRKLHHMIEHKEQHLETGSEKSDDKSVKSSLSTKDIIHECRLCYMVFPNEHSLNKHSVFCQRKKKQSIAKLAKPDEKETVVGTSNVSQLAEKEVVLDEAKKFTEEIVKAPTPEPPRPPKPALRVESVCVNKVVVHQKAPEKFAPKDIERKPIEPIIATEEKDVKEVAIINDKIETVAPEVPPKTKKVEDIVKEGNLLKLVPRKKTPVKEKVPVVASKVQETKEINPPLVPVSEDVTIPDDDEVRYMLNPDYKTDESKIFMEVRAKKRSSLQIEKPAKDSAKRRASLQNPPKIPRVKSKAVEAKAMPAKPTVIPKSSIKLPKSEPKPSKADPKLPKAEPEPSIDSDDSDVKYSFPETVAAKPAQTSDSQDVKKAPVRKSLTSKTKSLSGIAKRKSLGKVNVHKQKEKEQSQAPERVIKRRTLGVEHRCDCGQLFSSAALLSRHTSLAHTPPRIRRRRSPAPEPATADSRKSVAKSDQPKTRKSAGKSDAKTPHKLTKSAKKDDVAKAKTGPGKSRAAHKGVPVPEKMRKLAEKLKG